MSEISEVIASEIADFFAGFGGPGEPDVQSGEAQRLLTERLLSVLALRERAEFVADTDSCDPDVFERGTSACLVAIPKDDAEIICRGISAATGCKIDWHFVGGRVHIKALCTAPPAPVVPDCFERLLKHAYGMSMGNDWNKGTMAGHHREALCKAVEECRAAMLAAPGKEG